MTHFKELRVQDIANGVLANPAHVTETILNLNSPALEVVNNFTQHDPLRAHYETSIVDALAQTRRRCSNFILVVDHEEKLLGLVSSADLQSAKILSLAQRLNIPRHEVSLRDVMTPLSSLAGIGMQSLSYACIGDALQTMEHQGVMFLLATNADKKICGLISAREIARKLQIPVNISPIAHTFSEVMQQIEHPH
ncbi:CBS domain-containing protein [Pseudoalteromonas mariniglutinosa]|uniref:CBS domain-containing protein n=1 Tax=Pseudoalteromonas mariniglutinosa TaxID=206042 RepID=UPI00384C1671